jgi:hypothetical protein
MYRYIPVCTDLYDARVQVGMVCTFAEKYIPVHTRMYILEKDILVHTSMFRNHGIYQYIPVHGGSALVHSSTKQYITVHNGLCKYEIRVHESTFPVHLFCSRLLQQPVGPLMPRLKVESCRIAAPERHTSSITNHFIALFRLARTAA